jgi:hypothetical protein
MWRLVKRTWWILRNWTKWIEMRRAWKDHLASIMDYSARKAEFRRRKRFLSGKQLQRRRKRIRESGQRVVATATGWLDYSTEVPWLK